jgi:hypothetical protein
MQSWRQINASLAAAGILAVVIILAAGWYLLSIRNPEMGKLGDIPLIGRYTNARVYVMNTDLVSFQERNVKIDRDAPWREQVKTLVEGINTDPAVQEWQVRNVFKHKNQVIIDLINTLKYNRASSALEELRIIYSVRKTIASAYPDAQNIKILVGGFEQDTLAGHVLITQPFKR